MPTELLAAIYMVSTGS